MATIQVRALSPQWDPLRGAGLTNFLTDINAVGQIIATTIKLLEGEVFYNLTNGTPLFQKLLGHATTTAAVSLILQERILSVPYVTGINALQVVYGPTGRTFTFRAVVTTQFGNITVSNQAPPFNG